MVIDVAVIQIIIELQLLFKFLWSCFYFYYFIGLLEPQLNQTGILILPRDWSIYIYIALALFLAAAAMILVMEWKASQTLCPPPTSHFLTTGIYEYL